MVLAFSGHRPEKLPWGYNEEDPRCVALKIKVTRSLEDRIHAGYERFCCGMARGCDFYFADAVLMLQNRYPQITLEAFLPCETQTRYWSMEEQKKYDSILSSCKKVHLLQTNYTKDCMLRRNRMMVDYGDALLSVWDGTAGGTGATVQYAKRRNKPVFPLWL